MAQWFSGVDAFVLPVPARMRLELAAAGYRKNRATAEVSWALQRRDSVQSFDVSVGGLLRSSGGPRHPIAEALWHDLVSEGLLDPSPPLETAP